MARHDETCADEDVVAAGTQPPGTCYTTVTNLATVRCTGRDKVLSRDDCANCRRTAIGLSSRADTRDQPSGSHFT